MQSRSIMRNTENLDTFSGTSGLPGRLRANVRRVVGIGSVLNLTSAWGAGRRDASRGVDPYAQAKRMLSRRCNCCRST
jgi:hypothetical protein